MAQKKKFIQDENYDDDNDQDDKDIDSDQEFFNLDKDKKQDKKNQTKGLGINIGKGKPLGQFQGSSLNFDKNKPDDFAGGLGGFGGMGKYGGFQGMGGMGGMGRIGGMSGMGDMGQLGGMGKLGGAGKLNGIGRNMSDHGFGGRNGFGQNMFGGRFNDHNDLDHKNCYVKSSKPAKQQNKEQSKGVQQEETQEQKLARLTKKLDIPQSQQVTLVDWKIRGTSAEVIRLVLQFILVPYKQRKYDYLTKDQWYNKDQPKLQIINPIIELPYLQDGEKIIYGTQAIIVYLLHKYQRTQLLGSNSDNKVRLYTVSAMYWQVLQDYLELCYGEYDEQNVSWQKIRDKYVNQRFRVKLNKIVSYLKHRNSGTNELLWVDFAIYQLISVINQMDPKFKEHNIQIQNYFCRLQVVPQFIVYHRSSRFHERPYNGFGAIYK